MPEIPCPHLPADGLRLVQEGHTNKNEVRPATASAAASVVAADELREPGDMFAGLGDQALMQDAWSSNHARRH